MTGVNADGAHIGGVSVKLLFNNMLEIYRDIKIGLN
jgi:hypothetical protein